jgi:hypothetical protein
VHQAPRTDTKRRRRASSPPLGCAAPDNVEHVRPRRDVEQQASEYE